MPSRFLDETGPEESGRNSEKLVALDEYFHEKLMDLSRNMEMIKTMKNINARINIFAGSIWIQDGKKLNTNIGQLLKPSWHGMPIWQHIS